MSLVLPIIQPRDNAALRKRWDALCVHIGAFQSPADADLTYDLIVSLYEHPKRAYHTLDHIQWCLELFDTVTKLAEEPFAVETAIWLHDAVYFPERSDNESRSADAAGMIAGLLGCESDFVDSVKLLINATRHTDSPPSADAALLVDIDLAILAPPPATYDAYVESIAQEFGFADPTQFRLGRIAFLNRMVDRAHIFHSAWFGSQLEAIARDNLYRELDTLE